jgi:hypothetical protein
MAQRGQMYVSAYIPIRKRNLTYLPLLMNLMGDGIRRNRKMINMFAFGRKITKRRHTFVYLQKHKKLKTNIIYKAIFHESAQ